MEWNGLKEPFEILSYEETVVSGFQFAVFLSRELWTIYWRDPQKSNYEKQMYYKHNIFVFTGIQKPAEAETH